MDFPPSAGTAPPAPMMAGQTNERISPWRNAPENTKKGKVNDMKAMVNGIKRNGEQFDYIVEDIINVVYSNENIVLVKNDGTSVSYENAISNGYKYIISIM